MSDLGERAKYIYKTLKDNKGNIAVSAGLLDMNVTSLMALIQGNALFKEFRAGACAPPPPRPVMELPKAPLPAKCTRAHVEDAPLVECGIDNVIYTLKKLMDDVTRGNNTQGAVKCACLISHELTELFREKRIGKY